MKAILTALLAAAAAIHQITPLEHYDASTFIACSEVVAGWIELDSGNNISLGDIVNVALITKTLGKAPATGWRTRYVSISFHDLDFFRLLGQQLMY